MPKPQVQLLATCLCDAVYADVAQATVEVLEAAGCEVLFPEGQTCCGQPAFNSGDWTAARAVGRHFLKIFQAPLPVVVPSASCASMIKHGMQLAFEKEPELPAVKELASRTWELTEFLVTQLRVERWPGRYVKRVAFHRSCHSRGSLAGESAMRLLESIQGVTVLPFGEKEQCCGFGGTFSVSFPHISAQMGTLKLSHVQAASPEELVSGDMSCLMHLCGLSEKHQQPLKARHVSQVLRDSLVKDLGGYRG